MDDGSTVVRLTLLLKRNKRNNLELMFSTIFMEFSGYMQFQFQYGLYRLVG